MTHTTARALSADALSTDSLSADSLSADILLIDDSPDNLRLLVTLLSAEGYRVRPSMRGAQAIAAAQIEPPDLVLLDIKMPEMDGYEVCRRLKADWRTQAVPIIFLTVLDDVTDIVKGFELGGVDYITKPVRRGEVLSRVKNHIQIQSLRRQLVQQKQFLKNIYDSIEASISVVNVLSSGRLKIDAVNQTALKCSGMSRQRLEGANLYDVLPADVIERNHKACIEQRVPITNEEVVDFDGKTLWLLITHTPVFDEQGNVVRLIGTNINITEQKHAEIQLKERTEQLSKTLETLKSTQQDLIRTAKMAALGNLVAGVAHEINTPVGTAIMTASTLENASYQLATEVERGDLKRSSLSNYLEVASECSHLIVSNLQRAGELIQSFKQVAVDQSSLQKRAFALKPYLEEVISNLGPKLKQTSHQLSLVGDEDMLVCSYPGAIAQVVTNLIINSLTHAYPGGSSGHLKVSFHSQVEDSSAERQTANLQLCYSDDGRGINLEHQSRIFEPFFTTARSSGGSGLGLHLVYNLVTQKLEGHIDFVSTPDQGTTFTITLPGAVV
ncbi:MAG: response regulator [Cyanobacteria bacterium P01_D01_bin.1]